MLRTQEEPAARSSQEAGGEPPKIRYNSTGNSQHLHPDSVFTVRQEILILKG